MANLGKKYSSRNTQQPGTTPSDAQPKVKSRVQTPDNPPEPCRPPKPNNVYRPAPSPQQQQTYSADSRGGSAPVSDQQPIRVGKKDAEGPICGVFRSDRSSQNPDERSIGRNLERVDAEHRRPARRFVGEALRGFAGRLPVYWWLHLILIALTFFLAVEVIIHLDSIMAVIAYLVCRILNVVLILSCIGIAVFLLIRRMRRR